jgi:hypothetical protein
MIEALTAVSDAAPEFTVTCTWPPWSASFKEGLAPSCRTQASDLAAACAPESPAHVEASFFQQLRHVTDVLGTVAVCRNGRVPRADLIEPVRIATGLLCAARHRRHRISDAAARCHLDNDTISL